MNHRIMLAEDYNNDWRQIIADKDSSYNHDITEWTPIYYWIAERARGWVIDVGCGFGHLVKRLNESSKVEKVVGIDISLVAVEIAQKRNPGTAFVMTDIESSTLIEEGCYDCICFVEILEHIEKDRELIARIPKGKTVFISVPKEEEWDHPQHVHFFSGTEDVKERYKDLIMIGEIALVSHHEFICLTGIKK